MSKPSALARRAAAARDAMVDSLVADGTVRSPPVISALRRVPREDFVARFWTVRSQGRPDLAPCVREWRLDDGAAIDLIYDIDRALAIRCDPGRGGDAESVVTSTASAPRIVGLMLELLELEPGMNVLEVGAGSGYNAALIRELVGREGSVSTMEIDVDLCNATEQRLRAAGYGDVRVVAGDGYYGLAEQAPFDRVIVTVGSLDIAPAWLEQLAPGGFCLAPVQHGGWHPLMRIEPAGSGGLGSVVGRSGFVAIQGRQAEKTLWQEAWRTAPTGALEWEPLPEGLAIDAFPSRQGGVGAWDLSYLVALEDRRAAFVVGLASGGSSAVIDPISGRLGWSGPEGPELKDRLLEILRRWVAMGRPDVSRFTSLFTRLDAQPGEPGSDAHPGTRSEWNLERVDFRQTVWIDQSA